MIINQSLCNEGRLKALDWILKTEIYTHWASGSKCRYLNCYFYFILLTLPVRGGGRDNPQMFLKHNSAQNEPKPAKFFLIQV